jgi:hypothetical protein
MNPTQYQVFLKSPFVKSMEAGLVKFENSLKLLRKNENGFYEINHKVNGKDRWIEIKDLETFEKHYVDAVKADRNSRIKPKDDTSAKKAG